MKSCLPRTTSATAWRILVAARGVVEDVDGAVGTDECGAEHVGGRPCS
uniref:Uncharacterized protein n=1 Tax=Arundo donax TaxID=35708 RepID=A0A0A8ZMZ0_ARUDO